MAKPKVEATRYEVINQEDPETGDLILQIPQPILDSLGWVEGDDLEFDIQASGAVFIKKLHK